MDLWRVINSKRCSLHLGKDNKKIVCLTKDEGKGEGKEEEKEPMIMIMNESSESLNRDFLLYFSDTLNFFSNFLNLWMGDNFLRNFGTLGLLFLVLFPIRQQVCSRDS